MDNKIIIRQITLEDTENFLSVSKVIAYESTFMLRKPGEIKTTENEMRKNINEVFSKPNRMIFLAEVEGNIVGYLTCLGGGYEMTKNTAGVVIGILQSHTGQHLGTRLFEVMEKWAKSVGIHRLELKVDDGNDRGMALYKKMGYMVEGTTKDATFVDGKYRDAFMMSKLI